MWTRYDKWLHKWMKMLLEPRDVEKKYFFKWILQVDYYAVWKG